MPPCFDLSTICSDRQISMKIGNTLKGPQEKEICHKKKEFNFTSVGNGFHL